MSELRDAVARALVEMSNFSRTYGEAATETLDAIFAPENRAALVAELLERGVMEQPRDTDTPEMALWLVDTESPDTSWDYPAFDGDRDIVPLYRVLGEPS